jgi:hypothetical protein
VFVCVFLFVCLFVSLFLASLFVYLLFEFVLSPNFEVANSESYGAMLERTLKFIDEVVATEINGVSFISNIDLF